LAHAANVYYDLDAAKIITNEINELTKGFTVSGTGDILFSTTGKITQTGGGIVSFNGNVGIGTTSPAALLSVGATSPFQVDNNGAITATSLNTGSGTIQTTGAIIGGSFNGLTLTAQPTGFSIAGGGTKQNLDR